MHNRISKKQQVITYHKENPNLSQSQLAEIFMTQQGNISIYLKDYNFEKKTRRKRNIKQLRDQGMTIKDIAEELGDTYHNVYRTIKA